MATERDVPRVSAPDGAIGCPSEGGPDEAWQRVQADWDDDHLHQAYLAKCNSPAALAKAAGNYRTNLGDPHRKPVAERQLKRIATAAMAQLEVTRVVRQANAPSRPYGKLLLIGFFLLATTLLFRLL